MRMCMCIYVWTWVFVRKRVRTWKTDGRLGMMRAKMRVSLTRMV